MVEFSALSMRVSHRSTSTVVALVTIRKNVSNAKVRTTSSVSGEVSRASSEGDNNPTQSVLVASGTKSSLYGPWMQAIGRRRRNNMSGMDSKAGKRNGESQGPYWSSRFDPLMDLEEKLKIILMWLLT